MMQPAMGQPVAQPAMQKMSVTVPQGMMGGQELQVQTPAGLMKVTIPQGLGPGSAFEMMVPMPAQQPAMAQPAMGQPMMQMQQQPMMQMQQQPMMQMQQQPMMQMQQQPMMVQQAPSHCASHRSFMSTTVAATMAVATTRALVLQAVSSAA